MTLTKDQRMAVRNLLDRWKKEKDAAKSLGSRFDHDRELKTQYATTERTLGNCIKDVERVFEL